MIVSTKGALALLILCLAVCHGQENAQTRIPNSLVECYQDNLIFERDNRLPMTTNMLIEVRTYKRMEVKPP